MPDKSVHKKTPHLLIASLIFVTLLVSCRRMVSPTQMPENQSTPLTTNSLNKTQYPHSESTLTSFTCNETAGSIVDLEIPSLLLGTPINVKVYLPPCYTSNSLTDLPVLYMLHGQTSTNDQWVRIGLFSKMDELLNEKKIQPFIVVLPYEVLSNLDSSRAKYGEALLQEVIPYINTHFKVCQDRSCRAIGGLSRGGNWAVHMGFSYPESFIAIGAHSTPLFYGEISHITESVNALESTTELPAIYIDMGNKDEDKEDILTFVANLKKLSVPYQFTEFLGYHQEDYWSAHVKDYLVWYSDQFFVPPQE